MKIVQCLAFGKYQINEITIIIVFMGFFSDREGSLSILPSQDPPSSQGLPCTADFHASFLLEERVEPKAGWYG
jgi:hypothetical protein